MANENELSAAKLNEKIVSMRKIVAQARFRLSTKLLRRVRTYRASKNKDQLKMKRKIDRLLEEKIVPDDVSKFALINVKTLNKDLKVKDNTMASERVLFKLVSERVMLDTVAEFRKLYPDWHREVPFHLQRLGLQYKKSKQKQSIDKEEDEYSDDVQEGVKPIIEKQLKRNKTVVKDAKLSQLVMDEIKKVARKEAKKDTKLNKHKSETDESMTAAPPPVVTVKRPDQLTKTIVVGDGEIRPFSLDEIDDSSSPTVMLMPKNKPASASTSTANTVSSSFFVGGQDGDDDNDDDGEQLTKKKVTRNVSIEKRRLKAPANNPDDAELHPSWIAKRNERLTMEAKGGTSMGKKICFDDD